MKEMTEHRKQVTELILGLRVRRT